MGRWRRDLLLIVLCLAAAGGLALALRPGEAGGAVVVLRDGEEIGRYALSEDRTVPIGEGENYNLLTIRDGAAAVTEANCGDHTCVRTGWVRRAGERIVCLPHRLVIRVAEGSPPDLDAVTG